MTNRRALSSAVLLAAMLAAPAAARDAEEPIKLAYLEGDLGGFSNILDKDGKEIIGVVTYTQQRKGDTLEAKRVAWFKDGSSDEDTTVAKVGKTLRTLRGQSIIRDPSGETIVDMRVDVAQGRVWGFYGQGKDRTEFDDRGKIPIGTYFGALVNLVLKNFDANVEGGKVVFHTIVPTPSPRQIDMEVTRGESSKLDRAGHAVPVADYLMRVTVNPVLNPVVRMFAPETHFFQTPDSPPSLARFAGPRNYAGQEIRIE